MIHSPITLRYGLQMDTIGQLEYTDKPFLYFFHPSSLQFMDSMDPNVLYGCWDSCYFYTFFLNNT